MAKDNLATQYSAKQNIQLHISFPIPNLLKLPKLLLEGILRMNSPPIIK